MNYRYKNLVGKAFGKLHPVRVVERSNGGGGVLWECLCDCGNITNVRTGDLKKTTKTFKKSCGCSRIKPEEVIMSNYIYNQYKKDARYAKRGFYLSKKALMALINLNCYYCGIGPSNIFKKRNKIFKYNGIDRVVPTRGYYKDNCVTCCYPCNQSKHSRTQQEFLSWAERLYNHSIAGKTQ